ncbi:MAG TPA: hypothetical protein ENK85_09140 [Saprospiraceae bacterium]|nr:hypothetical protein [Saprospiraceae bacterium]
MKKIGILNGMENTFPQALIEKINAIAPQGIRAEAVLVEEVLLENPLNYQVIIDRISQDVPFYRTWLKQMALNGTAVLNNPLWWSADDKFTNVVIAKKIGIPVPKTTLLPSKEMPPNTGPNSFRNLKFPLDWDKMITYVRGFPLYLKQYHGGGWQHVYRIEDKNELFENYDKTGHLVMMMQENIEFDAYFRCYSIGAKHVRIMPYAPDNEHSMRYAAYYDVPKKLLQTMKNYVIRLNQALGYDINTVEFAVRKGIPYAIDFFNPAPDADLNSVGVDNFNWVVQQVAEYAIQRAQSHRPNQLNLTWGTAIR